MRKQFYAPLASLAVILTLSAGCSRGPAVYYGDPQAVETVTIGFGSTDLQSIAETMVNSLLSSAALGAERPVLYVATVKNRTDEHVDTKNITDKIRTALQRSGKVRFTAAMEAGDELLKQLDYQAASTGMVRADTAKQFGQQIGADLFLFGEITSIRKRAGRVEDVYLKFTLNLVDIESGLIEWADEKEIRKGEKRAMFGR